METMLSSKTFNNSEEAESSIFVNEYFNNEFKTNRGTISTTIILVK
jgi:hypothetical protein